MSDMSVRFGPDQGLINLENEDDVHYWAAKFDLSEAALVEAVLIAGEHTDDVRKLLARSPEVF